MLFIRVHFLSVHFACSQAAPAATKAASAAPAAGAAKPAPVEDTNEPVDETGLDPDEIATIMNQARCVVPDSVFSNTRFAPPFTGQLLACSRCEGSAAKGQHRRRHLGVFRS